MKYALASVALKLAFGPAREHGLEWCASSSRSRPISLAPCARSGMRQLASCCPLPIPRRWHFTWKQSVKPHRQVGMRYWCWTRLDGIPHRSYRDCPTYRCCRCQRDLLNRILLNRFGSSCVITVWLIVATKVTKTSSTPAARHGINSLKSRMQFARYARAIGKISPLSMECHDSGLVLLANLLRQAAARHTRATHERH